MICYTSCKITLSNTFCGTTAGFEYGQNDRFCTQNARRDIKDKEIKLNYYKDNITNNKGNPIEMWRYINQLTGKR